MLIKPSQKQISGVVAHRGSRLKAPENTMAAFRQAEADGAKSLELDVSETSDPTSRVLHDDTLDRTTNGEGPIAEHSDAEVDQLDAGSWFSPEFAGEKVPDLGEVLDWAKGRMHVDIEVKSNAATTEYADRLLKIVDEHEMRSEVTVTSFNREFVETVEKRAPDVDTGLLISARKAFKPAGIGALTGLLGGAAAGFATTGSLLAAAGGAVVGLVTGALAGRHVGSGYAREAVENTTADNVLPHWFLAGPGLVNKAHDLGKNVVPYTVNNDKMANVLVKFGVDGLVTDKPELMAKYYPEE